MSIQNLILTLVLLCPLMSFAAEIKVAVITSMSGKVEVFSEAPSSVKENLVIFNDKKFTSKNAKIGLKVNPGEILRTGSDGKLKVIYSTGDVVILGPSTALTVPEKTSDDKAPKMDLIYGKVRGMVEKGGPLSGLQIRTKSIVSGVRGTDLFVSYNPGPNISEVHVIRGEVAVANVENLADKNKVIDFNSPDIKLVKTGQVAVTDNKESAKPEKNVQVKASTQQDLKLIQSSTTVAKSESDKIPVEEKKELDKLEVLAASKILEDIKKTTPEVYKQMESQKIANAEPSIEQLNTAAVADVSKMAPKGSSKPKKSDFNNEEDVYKKFFKPSNGQ